MEFRHALTTILVFLLCCGTALAKDIRVAVISDLNGSYGSTDYSPRVAAAVSRIIALKPDLVISTGDMVAGQRRPVLTEPEVRAMWAAFHAQVTNPLRRAGIPLAVTPGNHDASAYGGFEEERRVFAEEWQANKPALDYIDDENYPFFYAFRLHGTTFVSLDATVLGPLRGDQAARLRDAAHGADTVIAFSHLPLWPFAIEREREIIGDENLHDLFRDLDVDLHLSGHHHAFYPGWKDGIAYVSQACLGGGPRRLIGTKKRSGYAITIIDISDRGRPIIQALEGELFDEPLDWADLPAKLNHKGSDLIRLDLSPE
jgi:3',5'-cyclic AMP phosphodiesterase CpdA